MIRTLIIEDETNAVDLLINLLKQNYADTIEIVGTGKSVADGRRLIEKEQPDLLLLDIYLSDGSCFELLDKIIEKGIKVIFTTAYHEFALEAFKVHVIDYLLKPIGHNDLKRALDKLLNQSNNNGNLIALKDSLEKVLLPQNSRISIPTSKSIELVDLDDILYISAERSYCLIHTSDNNKILSSKSLKEVENEIPQDSFIRIHKSYIVQMKYVKRYEHQDGGILVLKNGDSLPISRRKKNEILSVLFGVR